MHGAKSGTRQRCDCEQCIRDLPMPPLYRWHQSRKALSEFRSPARARERARLGYHSQEIRRSKSELARPMKFNPFTRSPPCPARTKNTLVGRPGKVADPKFFNVPPFD